MNYNEFTGEVQHRVQGATQGEGVRSVRAVLTTVGERLQAGEASDLASPLPMEVDWYLLNADSGRTFDWEEFVGRVADRADTDREDALYQARAVMALVSDHEPGDEVGDVRESLPADYEPLFELIDSGEEPWTAWE